jgi:5-methyltetrahydropteroyltriglutamate--homocysteine methyltransferase
MKHSDTKTLTTHVGSLIRPPEFVALLKAMDVGDVSAAARYPDWLREAVEQIVREQADIGIDVVSDGEFGKSSSWSRYILDRLTGFEQRTGIGLDAGEIVAKGRDRVPSFMRNTTRPKDSWAPRVIGCASVRSLTRATI